jgi:hypothetical protein
VTGGVRLDPEHIAGLSTRATVATLRALCPDAQADMIGVGGSPAVALRIDFPSDSVWAVQSAYDDSLRTAEPPDLWVTRGSHLQFPDGKAIPSTVGALRTLDSAGVILVDHGDDTSGSLIIRCRFPELAFAVSNIWPASADSGAVSLARTDPTDTAAIWRVEITPGHVDPRVSRVCKQPRA